MSEAIVTYKQFLMIKTGEVWEKLIDIINTPPAGGGAPEAIEYTTKSHKGQVFLEGRETNEPSIEVRANYTLAEFQRIRELADKTHDLAIWYGGTLEAGADKYTPTGADGKFVGAGTIRVRTAESEGGSDAQEMIMTLTMSKAFDLEAPETTPGG